MGGKSGQKVGGKSGQSVPEKYARIPDSVLHDRVLSATARCVYALFSRYTYQGTTVSIGHRRIAGILGLHKETVGIAVRELEERKHIVIKGKGKARRVYHLQSPVFGQKQRAGIEEVISSPRRTPRLASVRGA